MNLKPELKDTKEIIAHLKSLGASAYYLVGNMDYLWDHVENGWLTEEQYNILNDEKNLDDLVHESYNITEEVELPDEIIQAIKEAKAQQYSIQGMVIDWSCENCFDFDYTINNWINEDEELKEAKLNKIYAYGVINWDNL